MNFGRLQKDEAYIFALCFLMPENKFKTAVNKHTSNNRCDIGKVAEEFKVEKDKAIERGYSLGLWKPM